MKRRLFWWFMGIGILYLLPTVNSAIDTLANDDEIGTGLNSQCGNDLARFCPTSTTPYAELTCLFANKDSISNSCYQYITTTTAGGCNTDAQNFCGDYSAVNDIYDCLLAHESELSATCIRNLENYNNNLNNQQKFAQLVSLAVSVLSTIFLSIPVFLLLCTVQKMQNIHQLQEKILKDDKSIWKEHSEVKEVQFQRNGLTKVLSNDTDSRQPWCISFHNINYWAYEKPTLMDPFTKKKKAILNNVSGQLQASRVTAIMGPSGSGKTTLLKLLSGQMFSGELCGMRAVNNHIPTRQEYDKLLRTQGYVSQYDCLLPSLTVWQTLLYAALLRLPDEMSMEDKMYRAAFIMEEMGIAHIAHTPIGSMNGGTSLGSASTSNMKGISGGQRRRLSIALELLAKPSIILLDEPTSGLDSATTLKIVKSLHRLSRQYRTTIVFTIHSPRSEVFALFDSLMLLGTGGHMVYFGPTARAAIVLANAPSSASYHQRMIHENPGDFIIDILGLNDEEEHPHTKHTRSEEEEELLLPGNDDDSGDIESPTPGSDESSPVPVPVTVPVVTETTQLLVRVHDDNEESQLIMEQDEEAAAVNRVNHDESERISTVETTQNASTTAVTTIPAPAPSAAPIIPPLALPPSKPSTPQPLPAIDATSRAVELAKHFLTTDVYQLLLHQLQPAMAHFAQLRPGPGNRQSFSMMGLTTATPHYARISPRDDSVPADSSSSPTIGIELIHPPPESETILSMDLSRPPQPPAALQPSTSSTKTIPTVLNKVITTTRTYPVSFWQQVLILFTRRCDTLLPSFTNRTQTILCHLGQVFLIGCIIAGTFNYTCSTLETPYQVLMILSIISLYAMVLQYLQLIPEYMIERSLLISDTLAGYTNPYAYMLAVVYTEIPRAILHSVILIIAVYIIHPLNPATINQYFTVICLIIGVCAFQGAITICAMITDSIELAYSITFLVISSGTLFGGIMVRLEKLFPLFRAVYFTSVVAITQRALISNDMDCCYLTATCNMLVDNWQQQQQQLQQDGNNNVNGTFVCPDSLQFSGDGSDYGNLGRAYVAALNLSFDKPFYALAALCGAMIAFRIVAVWIIKYRILSKDDLKEIWAQLD